MSSGKGAKIEVKRRVAPDSRTGRAVWAVSPEGVNSGASYMYISQFSPDERYLFYESEVSGALQLHRYEIETGILTQVTDAAKFEWLHWNVHPAGREVFYAADQRIWAADIETLESRLVLDPAPPGQSPALTEQSPASPWRRPAAHPWMKGRSQLIKFSRTGRWLSFGYQTQDGLTGIGRASCDGKTVQRLHTRPQGEGVQHLMFCNAEDEDLMSFSPAPDHQQEWDGPREIRPRTYLLHARAGTVEPVFLLPKPFTATHDFWSPNGDRLYFHKKTRPTWVPTWICSCDRRTREIREVYRQDALQLGHSYCTPDERWIVSDVQKANDNPLVLIETATGKGVLLCWPNSSVAAGRDYYSHVHPSFSPSGRFILFTSDASGFGQVYLLPTPETAGTNG